MDRSDLEALDAEIAAIILREDSAPSILSVARYKQLEFTYECMRYLMRGSGAKVTHTLHQPLKSIGVVTVEGSLINIPETDWFLKATEYASCVEIYPLVNGNVRMEFTFHGLTTPL